MNSTKTRRHGWGRGLSAYKHVCVGRDDDQSWFHVASHSRPSHERQQEQRHQECRHDIDGNGALKTAISLYKSADGNSRILNDDVQPVQLVSRPTTEVLDALKACEIDLPDVHDSFL